MRSRMLDVGIYEGLFFGPQGHGLDFVETQGKLLV